MLMRSACPSCLSMTEHEDHVFEVACECGTRFNPFMTEGDQTGMATEPTQMDTGPSSPVSALSESTAAFQDIRSFGETLGGIGDPLAQAKAQPKLSPQGPPAVPTAPAPTTELADGMVISTGDSLHGHTIESYLPPVSVWAELGTEGPNPLRAGFESLAAQALGIGANGLISVRWSLAPDGMKALVVGTPVRCVKSP